MALYRNRFGNGAVVAILVASLAVACSDPSAEPSSGSSQIDEATEDAAVGLDQAPDAPGDSSAAASEMDAADGSAANAGAAGVATSTEGLYVVQYFSELTPPVVGELHAWHLTLMNAQGAPVSDAAITVMGGMEGHSHGLASEPQIVAGMEPGAYTVEGMKFQMAGDWELSLGITSEAGTDAASIPVTVQQP